MEHNDVRHRLSDYLDGSLPAEEKAAIESHIKNCALCSDALRELQKTVEYVKTVEAVDPPAWMTQKIMAGVRKESQQRKGVFARLFLPLSVKLPIQAVAVVFLAVAAFYIYRNIPSASRPPETPIRQFATEKSAPQAGIRTDKAGKAHESVSPLRQVPRSPGYKALDMKQEYEKPALPVPQEGAGTPAQEKQAGQNLFDKKETAGDVRTAAPQPVVPAMQREGASVAAPRLEAERKSADKAQGAFKAASDKAGPEIVVQVRDIEAAGRKVEQAIPKYGGSITRRETPEAKRIYVVTIDAQKIPELKTALRLIGEMKDEGPAFAAQKGRVVVTIELIMNSARP